ncbi:hypothetical protein VitviT2T_024423 [Vitis vinifera]|uniref:Uncharacterized protein n=1 Tax=Vitis vinifera TaxID=29760 RepID=A0ABY9DHM5_VITVI|nr:hypothetical protein VitviT2T_024423 [Vitis vinifera]
MLTSTNVEDIPPNCFDQFNVEMKRETEESSSQEAQLEDKLVNIFEANSKNRTLQTNAITETRPQAEEVDNMKLEETL